MSRSELLSGCFRWIVGHPVRVMLLGCCLIVSSASGLLRLHKDTSVEAFIPADHPSLKANERKQSLFGLADPVAVAVLVRPGQTVFDPAVLKQVAALTDEIAGLAGVRGDRVASLATESSIVGRDAGIRVDRYTDAASEGPAKRWRAMPPHVGTLVSDDERGAVIMAELVEGADAAEVYANFLTIAEGYQTPEMQVLVGGPAAVSGFLSQQIDQDARLLQPIVFGVVMLFLYLAFRRASALLGPVVVLLGAAGGALGIMAWQGVAYFAITNALPVILIAISVADAIHVLSAYFELRARFPEHTPSDCIVDAMSLMARPITLTTVTTVAGFFGIAWASIMPPISYFALYAMLGVVLAWSFSMVVLPAVLALVKPAPSPCFRASRAHRGDALARALGAISGVAVRRPATVVAATVVLMLLALAGALQLRIDRSQVDNFAPDDPLRIADETIHESFAGTAFLDVVVRSTAPESLLDARRLEKVAQLQAFLERLPHVSKTVSIVDYLSLLDYALNNEPARAERRIPAAEDAVAQYLMVYEASGDPSDLEEEITPDYESALVRVVLDSHYFSDSREVVAALDTYLKHNFNESDLRAEIAGDVNIAYHWMTRLADTHFLGVGASLLLIAVVSIAAFRSLRIGLIAVMPVSLTILTIYAAMGYSGVYLEPATSMFAAISVGVGVDFALHLVARLESVQRDPAASLEHLIESVIPSVARACLFNAAALGVGFSVLLASDLPTLQRFGGLIALATLASFLVALLLVPACYALLEPGRGHRKVAPGAVAVLVLGSSVLLLTAEPSHASPPSGDEIAQRVFDRPEPVATARRIRMTLTDKRGRARERDAMILRQNNATLRLSRISYLSPKSVRALTFLSHDPHQSAARDQRWLYVPAVRKVRRIPASNRGDYFLGTDFTYEDLRLDMKFEVSDYSFETLETRPSPPSTQYRVRGTPRNERVAAETGYGAFEATIEADSWYPLKVDFFDRRQARLKTIEVIGLEQVDGYWTPTSLVATHHQSGHRTRFDYVAVVHRDQLADALFRPGQLSKGLPKDLPGLKP